MFSLFKKLSAAAQPKSHGVYQVCLSHKCGWIGIKPLIPLQICPECGSLNPDFEIVGARQVSCKDGQYLYHWEWEIAQVANLQENNPPNNANPAQIPNPDQPPTNQDITKAPEKNNTIETISR